MSQEKGKISSGNFIILVILFSIGSSILIAPNILAVRAKQDAWLAYLLSLTIGMIFLIIYHHLASLYPTKTFVEYSEKILGKWLGKLISVLFIYYFFYLTAMLLREIGDFFTTNVLVETPIQIIIVMFLITCLIGVRLGLEIIVRTAVIFFPWVIGLMIILLVFLIPEYKLENLQPIFEGGIKPIINGSYHTLAVPFLELAIFLMIYPFINDQEKMKLHFSLSAIIGGVIILFLVTFSLLALSPTGTEISEYPYYLLAKKISIGGFLERIEIIVAIIWFFTIYFKLTICYLGTALGLTQLLGLKNYQILLFPLALLIICYAIVIYPDTVYFHKIVNVTWTPFSLTICFFLPLLLLIVGKFKKKHKQSNVPQN